MTEETTAKVMAYKESVKNKAEELVMKNFPAKIVLLNEILDTPLFNIDPLHEIRCELGIGAPDPVLLEAASFDPATKKRKVEDVVGTKVQILPDGNTIHCNAQIKQMIQIVKPHIWKLVEDTNLLKMWIAFLIPKIEDGNNFGVSIQEDTLAEIRTAESEAAAFFDQISRYYSSRGKLVSKVAKYPYIDDYRETVNELDEKEYVSLRLVLCEVRNHYSSLHDIITKNFDKIKKPRSSNVTSLY
ncbi:proteasome activator complex subunit 3-like [Artemia franciscana]|uniref:Proteasome activator complex subunit 3 n=1 Tax=Artemia franciscana TaxID=6661 RepID=A0AA88HED9_ARTSF|nr:hypothetical protein QYM36_015759 [Artemia franciscana]